MTLPPPNRARWDRKRIARDRANRFMVAAPDVDFLLDVIVRLSR